MKSHLRLIALLLLSPQLATLYGDAEMKSKSPPHSSSEVFLSHPCSSFEVEFSPLFLKPSSSNLHYAAEAIPLPLPSPDWKISDIHPDTHFGFDVGLCGIFHRAHTALSLDWEHFHSSDSASKEVSSNNMIGPFFEIGPDAQPYKKAEGHAKFHFDQVNLDYGLFVHFGRRLEANLFAGAAYAHIKQTVKSTYSNSDKTIVRQIRAPSTFSGAGPQFGVDFSYCLVKGLHVTGESAASLFVGTLKNHTSYASLSPLNAGLGVGSPNKQGTSVHRRKGQVVPGFEGSLGLAYCFTFCKHYLIEIAAGYQAQVYFNAVQSVDMSSEVINVFPVPDTEGVFARTFTRTLSNFALSGPYARLNLGF
jgi:hypothetical protein